MWRIHGPSHQPTVAFRRARRLCVTDLGWPLGATVESLQRPLAAVAVSLHDLTAVLVAELRARLLRAESEGDVEVVAAPVTQLMEVEVGHPARLADLVPGVEMRALRSDWPRSDQKTLRRRCAGGAGG